MIVRKPAGGELILIGQTDHSRFVGQLAANWGNADFEGPRPYESVVRAAAFHDFGWLRYETSPLLNSATGEPYSFLQLPLSAEQLAAYQWGLDWMAGIDRYSGLIVSMHRTGLWKGRYQTIRHPEAYNIRSASPDILDFIQRNEAWQDRARTALDREEIWINYRLLQVWDLLGLYFCCQEPCDDYVEPVPLGYSDKQGVRLTMKPAGTGQVLFEPYPFGVRPCRVQLSYKRLPKTTFESIESFHRAYFAAENDIMRFELI